MPITFNTNYKTEENNITHYLNDFNLKFKSKYKLFKSSGVLAWAYNPFRNFRLDHDATINNINYLKGQLVDFDTKQLKFDINHPVDILCQPSYDGSVNLILNDDLNPPRLINSRFTPLEDNTYQIVDRNGNNDTNIYDENQFDIDTSLYKRVTTIANLTFKGLSDGGNLKVGNYVFYFKYADADGNETDFIEESGIVTCHIGNINDPRSIRGGILDENSYKSVNFELSNIDSNYEYLNVYYSRSTSNEEGVEQISVFKILKNYLLKKDKTFVTINGFENTESLTTDELNILNGVADAVKAQAQCQNMLFFGNIVKPGLDYNSFRDLSLRFYPSVTVSDDIIGDLKDYYPINLNPKQTSDYMYYNAYNIYNKLGYWNEEIYRLGIVYILSDGTLSPVFNIRGRDNLDIWPGIDTIKENYNVVSLKNSQNEYQKINFDEETYLMENKVSELENIKGVIRINPSTNLNIKPHSVYGINVFATKDILEELKSKHGVKGFFFVRQKRIPTILNQMITIGGVELKTPELTFKQYVPTIPLSNDKYLIEAAHISIGGNSYPINTGYENRAQLVNRNNTILSNIAISPDFELNTPYFNSIFTGSEFVLKLSNEQPLVDYFEQHTSEQRLYQIENYKTTFDNSFIKSKIITVPDASPIIGLDKDIFFAKAANSSIPGGLPLSSAAYFGISLRGDYGPFLGLNNNSLNKCSIYNVYTPQYNTNLIKEYFTTRMNDSSPYYSIGNRLDINNYISEGLNDTFYRGDCFICDYTHRMNRNFEDPTMGFTDRFVNPTSNVIGEIDTGDWNAVKIGHWITFRVRSNMNLSMRTIDGSNINEKIASTKNRTFYPLTYIYPDGHSKIPDSFVINKGISSTTSDKLHIEVPDVPAIKNSFDSRIMYSDLHITDAFKNGYRAFKEINYKDYTKIYGGIVKLIDINSNLLIIFEHGIALVAVNERVLAGNGDGGSVFINTQNVLPHTPFIISDIYGSQWADSVIKTQRYIYGVDTVGKKVWRTDGKSFTIISDFKIQKFLNDNITLGERDLTPTIGLRNVKTHYNKSKFDIMFTFYDNLHNFEEKVWNICFNEYTNLWTTFYSWVPSYSANIHNIFFSFDRNTSKWISKAWETNTGNYIGLNDYDTEGNKIYPYIKLNSLNSLNSLHEIDYTTSIGTFFLNKDDKNVEFKIERDRFRNDLIFKIVKEDDNYLLYPTYTEINNVIVGVDKNKLYQLNIAAYIDDTLAYKNTIIVGVEHMFTQENDYVTNYFYKHGQSGLFNESEKIKPCFWYGKQHPFEFEFVVADKPGYHKLFQNLQIISNKEAPESFHYEIVGEAYDFADDKQNMYFRQEATKHVYQYNSSNILFNSNYLDLELTQQNPSNLMTLYQSRVDTLDEIEDSYQSMTSSNKDYQNMSGSEIIYDEQLNEFRISTHIPAINIQDAGRLRGNMNYQEDQWLIQIPSINYKVKSELSWNFDYPPLNLTNNPLPKDLPNGLSLTTSNDIPVELENLRYRLNEQSFDLTIWNEDKQVKIKDKYIKIKIRYTGKNLAVIAAIKTLYNISYA